MNTKKNILILDSEPGVRFNLLQIFTRLDYEAYVTDSWELALDWIEMVSFEFVFLNISMEEKNGCQITKKIKKVRSDQKIVLITSMSSDKTLSLAQIHGANIYGYLIKPISLKKVMEVLYTKKTPVEKRTVGTKNHSRRTM